MPTSFQFIKSVKTNNSVTSVDMTDVFTTKYDMYLLTFSELDINGAGAENIDLRLLDSSGSAITASEYDYASLQLRYGSSFTQDRATGQAQFLMGAGYVDATSVGAGSVVAYFYSPASASYTFFQHQQVNTSSHSGQKYIGVHKSAEVITGIQIRVDSGTIDRFGASMYGVL